MMYDLIVSIVVYRPNMEHLQQTLTSLSNSPVNLKVLLADNSPVAIEHSCLHCSKPLQYTFTGQNLGYGRAHNLTLLKSKDVSPYILILNPDVFFDTPLLPALLEQMRADTSIGLCIPKICHPQGHMQIINRRIPRPVDYIISFLSGKLNTDFFKTKNYQLYQLKDINSDKPFICPTISGCFMMLKNDAFKKMGGFDERFFLYMEDTDLSRRIAENYKTVVFSNLTAYHHWSRGAYRSTKLFVLFVRSLVYYFNKWGWLKDLKRDQLNSQVDYYPSSSQKSKSTAENTVWNHARI
jgi:GT2 family glycosyltransferase